MDNDDKKIYEMIKASGASLSRKEIRYLLGLIGNDKIPYNPIDVQELLRVLQDREISKNIKGRYDAARELLIELKKDELPKRWEEKGPILDIMAKWLSEDVIYRRLQLLKRDILIEQDNSRGYPAWKVCESGGEEEEIGKKDEEERREQIGTQNVRVEDMHGVIAGRDVQAEKIIIIDQRGKKTDISSTPKPQTPLTFIPHPYPEAPNFTGRKKEREMLTNWLTKDKEHPLLSMVTIGGMGKSALAWRWLQKEVIEKGLELDGIVWWSFYEKGMTFDSFVRNFVAYRWGKDSTMLGWSSSELQNAVYQEFQQKRYLIVLDGVERILKAYFGLGSPYQMDDNKTLEKEKDYRVCIDPNAATFLQYLANNITKSKTLLTTRLHPKALDVQAGCQRIDLKSMDPDDAVEFFHSQEIKGTRSEIQAACEPYGYHPLKLRLLSGLILEDKENPGDCSQSKYCEIGDVAPKEHYIMEISYNALDKNKQYLFSSLAAFRAPMGYPAIKGISKFKTKQELDNALTELVNRGLLFWDKEKNRYDLHPIVRSYCYDRLRDKEGVHSQLRDYFASVPEPEKIESLDDLQPVIELYHHTVGTGRYDEAYQLYLERMSDQFLYNFGAYNMMIELSSALFPEGIDKPPKLSSESSQGYILNHLRNAYALSGHSRLAVKILQIAMPIAEKLGEKKNYAVGLGNLANRYRDLGDLESAEANLRRRIEITKEVEVRKDVPSSELGRIFSYTGQFKESNKFLFNAEEFAIELGAIQYQSVIWSYRTLRALLLKDPKEALHCAQKALEFAKKDEETDARTPRDFIHAHYLLGASHVALKDLAKAEEFLQLAITECRKINLVENEAPILLELARLRHLQKNDNESLKLTTEALEIANRSSYVFQQADIHLFLAQFYKDLSDLEKVKEHAELAKLRSHQMIDVKTGDYLTKPEDTEWKYKSCYDKAKALLLTLE